jgi:colicin import membrane protein
MSSVDSRDESVPPRAVFDLAWRGYDRRQVRQYVHSTETTLRTLVAARDAAVGRAGKLVRQLEDRRSDNSRLRAQLDRVCRSPIETGGLQERLRRMVELAEDEAAQIVARAQATAAESQAHTEQATQDRQQIERDFEIAMAARRAEAMRALAEQKTAAEAAAERVVREAREHAGRILADARQQAHALHGCRDRLLGRLKNVRQLLDTAAPLLHPQPGEPRHTPAHSDHGRHNPNGTA